MEEYILCPLTSSQQAEWDTFVANHPQGHLLQSWSWGELKAGADWHPLRLALREKRAGKIVAAAQVLRRTALHLPPRLSHLVLQQHLTNSSRREKLRLLESLEQTRPASFLPPALITTRDSLPGSKTGWQVAPGRACGHDPQDALEDQAMFSSWASDPGLWEQQRTQPLPALCRQFWQTHNRQLWRHNRGEQRRLAHATKTMRLNCTCLLPTSKRRPVHRQGMPPRRLRLSEEPTMNLRYS